MRIADLAKQYNKTASSSESMNGTRGVEKLVSSIRDMTAGNVFEGTVNYVKNGKVILGLSNGTEISARLDANMQLVKGQSMFFQVKSNTGDMIAIRPYTVDGSGVNLTLLNALKAAGLPATEKYLNMANAMMHEHMPIDRNSMGQMARILMANPDMSVNTLVQMKKLDIPITSEMVAQFENYMDDSSAVHKALDGFIAKLPSVMTGKNMSLEQVKIFDSQLLQILADGMDEMMQLVEGNATVQETGNVQQSGVESAQNTAGNPAEQANGNSIQAVFGNGAEHMQQANGIGIESAQVLVSKGTEGMQQLAGNTTEAAQILIGNIEENLQNTTKRSTEAMQQSAEPENVKVIAGENEEFVLKSREISAETVHTTTHASEKTSAQVFSLIGKDGTEMMQPVSNADVQNVAAKEEMTDKIPNTEQIIVEEEAAANKNTELPSQKQVLRLINSLFGEIGVSKDDTPSALLHKLSNFIANGENVSKDALNQLFSSKSMRQFLQDVMEGQMYLTPEDVADANKVEKLYERLENKTQSLQNLLNSVGLRETPLAQTIADVHNNVEFMNQLNQNFTYVQIPLKMSGQNASGQLYVYTKKRDLNDPDKELTAFLHLDLDNLGSTDVSVRLHRKKVDTKFYMDNDAAYALIQKYMPKLEERLRLKGYSCKIYIENEGKQVNFVEDFLKKDAPAAEQLHRYSFDVRA